MKNRFLIYYFIFVMIVLSTQVTKRTVESQFEAMQDDNTRLEAKIDAVAAEVAEAKEQFQSIRDSSIILNNPEPDEASRGFSSIEPVTMRVTAYDLSFASCEKTAAHPEYGITASGNPVKKWHTVAAGPELPFGTKIFIPAFADKPNKGIFTVQDRGSAIKEGCLDIFMPDHTDCLEFGVKSLPVFILKEVDDYERN